MKKNARGGDCSSGNNIQGFLRTKWLKRINKLRIYRIIQNKRRKIRRIKISSKRSKNNKPRSKIKNKPKASQKRRARGEPTSRRLNERFGNEDLFY